MQSKRYHGHMSNPSPNRFVHAIRSGEIDSIDELKASFRAHALATHPDTAATADPGEAFISMRAEYEAALANFERHRFGISRRLSGGSSDGAPRSGERNAHVDAAELWGCLSLMLKRGFPKEARHEKEILRYEYARWRWRGALEALGRKKGSTEPPVDLEPSLLLDAFEACLLGLEKTNTARDASLTYLRELCDYASRRLPAMRVALVRAFDALRADARLTTEAKAFLLFLSSELGIGPTLGGRGD